MQQEKKRASSRAATSTRCATAAEASAFMKRESALVEGGTKVIVPLPEVTVVPA